MKKVLSLVLVLTLVLGSLGMAFAAPASDVAGTEYANAVETLNVLNIMTGYEDGTFKPGNQITRAEFAALVVRALGQEEVAKMANASSTFSDVPAKAWYTGYVNVAASLKIVNGMGDGSFAPNAPVTYEQAVTMIMRALGYEPDAAQKGGYPLGYMLVAGETGVTTGVKGVMAVPASRGIVAQLLNNALTAPMMVAVEFGNGVKYVKADGVAAPYKDLLGEFLGADLYETNKERAVVVTGIERTGQKAGKIAINGKTYTLAGIAKDVDQEELYGLEVRAWINAKDEVLRIELNDKVMVDSLQVTIAEKEIKLLGENAKYTLAKNPTLYIDDKAVDVDDLKKNDFYEYAKVSLDRNGDVDFLQIFNWDGFYPVEKVEDKVLFSHGDELDLKYYTIVKEGKTISIDDLEEGDILFFNDKLAYAEVYNDSTTGEIEKVFNDIVVIDGEDYEYKANYSVYVDAYGYLASFNKDAAASMNGNGKVEIFFNRFGEVAFVKGILADVTTSTVGGYLFEDVVVDSDVRGNDFLLVDMVNQKGEKVSYRLKTTSLEIDVVTKWATNSTNKAAVELVVAAQKDAWSKYSAAEKTALINAYVNTNTDPSTKVFDSITKDRMIRVTYDAKGNVTKLFLALTNSELDADFDIKKDTYVQTKTASGLPDLRTTAGTLVFLLEDYFATGNPSYIKVVKLGDIKDFEEIKAVSGSNKSVVYDNGYGNTRYITAVSTDRNDTEYKLAVVTAIHQQRNTNVYRVSAYITDKEQTLYSDAKAASGFTSGLLTDVANNGYAVATLGISKNTGEIVSVVQDTNLISRTVGSASVADGTIDGYTLVSDAIVFNATKSIISVGKLRDISSNDDVVIALDRQGTVFAKFVFLEVDRLPNPNQTGTFSNLVLTSGATGSASVTVSGNVYNTNGQNNEYVLKVTDVDSGVVQYSGDVLLNSSQTTLSFANLNLVQYRTYKFELFVNDPNNAKNLKQTWDNQFVK